MTLTDADLARLDGHTPGPLRAETDEEQWWSVIDSESFTIADLIGCEADARLFAAAPDLVAELRGARAALARIEALCEQAVAGYQPHDVTPWVAVHELRAALAGES